MSTKSLPDWMTVTDKISRQKTEIFHKFLIFTTIFLSLKKRWCWYKAITLYQRRHEATLRYVIYKGAIFRLLRDVRTHATGRTYSKYLEVARTITPFDKNIVHSTIDFNRSQKFYIVNCIILLNEPWETRCDSQPLLLDTFFRLRASTHRLNILRMTRHVLIDLRTTAKHSRPGDNEAW